MRRPAANVQTTLLVVLCLIAFLVCILVVREVESWLQERANLRAFVEAAEGRQAKREAACRFAIILAEAWFEVNEGSTILSPETVRSVTRQRLEEGCGNERVEVEYRRIVGPGHDERLRRGVRRRRFEGRLPRARPLDVGQNIPG